MKEHIPGVMLSGGAFLILWIFRALIILGPGYTDPRTNRQLVYTVWPVLDPIMLLIWLLIVCAIWLEFD